MLILTASAIPIIWREIARASSLGDRQQAGHVFVRSTQILFFTTLALCAWLAAGSDTLVRTWAGDRYAAGVPVLAIMAFYPTQQTLGQLNTTALKATGRTTTFRNLSLALSVPDLALTSLLLAPASAPVPGLGLGAIGVALRMVVYGLASVLVYEWFNLRHFELSWRDALAHKIRAAVVVGACGYCGVPRPW